jgi:hypothetical protein
VAEMTHTAAYLAVLHWPRQQEQGLGYFRSSRRRARSTGLSTSALAMRSLPESAARCTPAPP